MNGFEPIRRRIVDYTLAGQSFEVYDGLRDECDEARLKTENKQLRELIGKMFFCSEVVCGGCWSGVTDVRECDNDGCECKRAYDVMRALGIEVDDE